MKRTLIKDLSKVQSGLATIEGRIIGLRTMGNISFVIVEDYTDTIQVVFEKPIEVKFGDAIRTSGKLAKDKRAKSGYELKGEKIEIISAITQEIPIDLSKKNLNLQIHTLLDHRSLSIRHPKIQAIFKLYALILESYAFAMRTNGFTEIKTPKLLGAASEGGANFFKVDYFEQNAYLAQSPQLYKQICMGAFERVFEIGTAFRAEPHFTTRHVNEYTSFDAEMGFIESYEDVMNMLNEVLISMFEHIKNNGQEYLAQYNTELPKVPSKIPAIKLSEIKEIIAKQYKYEIPKGTDIDPEGERLACRYAKEKYDSDFIFLTHYPFSDRPFYTMRSREDAKETYGFDLLFKGVEIATGSQREHLYKNIIKNMEAKNIKSAGLEFYLDTFKFAMPPHGGWGMGSERFVQLILGLASVKEAVLFPRDVKRLTP